MKILMIFTILWSLNSWANGANDEAPIITKAQRERLIDINDFLLNGFEFEGTEEFSSKKQREFVEADAIVASFESCEDPLLNAARAISFTKSGYGYQETVAYGLRVRNRRVHQGINKRCPVQLSWKNVLPYIYRDDLYSFEEVNTALNCDPKTLYFLGKQLDYIQGQTYEEFVEKRRLRYVSDANARYVERNRRYRQVRRQLESNCQRAIQNEPLLQRSYGGDFSAVMESDESSR